MTLFLRLSLVLIIFLLGPLSWLGEHGMTLTRPISKSEVGPQGGLAMSAPDSLPALFQSATDGMEMQTSSTLRLFEDGKELGPAHSLHDTIRSEGHGAFSHWGHDIYFSSSDGSDPRTNARVYKYVDRVHLTAGGAALIFAVPLLVLACGIALVRTALRMSAWRLGAPVISHRSVPGSTVQWVDRWENAKARAGSLAAPHSLARLAGLTALYSAVFLMIYCSLAAQRSGAGSFKINFEYKVF